MSRNMYARRRVNTREEQMLLHDLLAESFVYISVCVCECALLARLGARTARPSRGNQGEGHELCSWTATTSSLDHRQQLEPIHQSDQCTKSIEHNFGFPSFKKHDSA